MPFYAVRVAPPDGRTAMPGIMWATWTQHLGRARELWAARERQLRAAGYEYERVR